MSEHSSSPLNVSPDLQQKMESVLGQPNTSSQAEYQMLKGHKRTDGSFKTDEQLRSEYIHRTDEIIHQMTDGVYVTDPATGETTKQRPDYVVWLDKSARPVAWLTKELWPKLAPAPGESKVPKMPEFRFVNIDREQWVNTVDPQGSGLMDINLVDQSIIRSLRSVFVSPKHKKDGLTPEIDRTPAELDNKTVLIIDEVMASGRTLQIASDFFKRAFPTSRVAVSHWMGGQAQREGAMGNADLPIWYVEDSDKGRLVGNRDERTSQKSSSLTQRLGSWFLSTRFPEMDPASLRLRAELKQLAHDERVLIRPSLQRDDYDERASKLNNMDFETFKATNQQLSKKAKRPNY